MHTAFVALNNQHIHVLLELLKKQYIYMCDRAVLKWYLVAAGNSLLPLGDQESLCTRLICWAPCIPNVQRFWVPNQFSQSKVKHLITTCDRPYLFDAQSPVDLQETSPCGTDCYMHIKVLYLRELISVFIRLQCRSITLQ